MAVVFMIFIQMAIPSWKKIIPQLIVASFLVIFVAPIIDWIVSGGKGLKMTYFFDAPKEMFFSFFSLFFKNFSEGVTLGLKIEGILILLFLSSLVYFTSKNGKNWLYTS